MINTSKYFYTYIPYPSNEKIITTDSSLNSIASNDNIKLTPTIFLKKCIIYL